MGGGMYIESVHKSWRLCCSKATRRKIPFQQQIEQTFAPVRKLQATLIDHAEKVAKFNLEALQSYTELSLNQARELASSDSPEKVQSYLQNAQKTAQQVGEKVLQDGKKFAELNQAAGEDVRKAAEENVATATKAAQDAASKATNAAKDAAA